MVPPAASSLDPHSLLVRYAWSEALADAQRMERGLRLLSEDERARAARFHFDRDRRSYVLAHALVRTELARIAAVPPQALRFVAGEHGRPELAWPELQPRVRFNLSHTHGLVACAFALVHDVGVDVEHVERRLEIDRLASSVFSPAERLALAPLRDGALRARFFQLWTAKEAYIKARGMGLALPLREITVNFAVGSRPELELTAAIADDAARWWLDVRPLGQGHMLALALAAEPRNVEVCELDPTA